MQSSVSDSNRIEKATTTSMNRPSTAALMIGDNLMTAPFVGTVVKAPKKSCLKKTSSFPTLLEDQNGSDLDMSTSQASQDLYLESKRRANPGKRRRHRRQATAGEATGELLPQSTPLMKSSTDTNLRLLSSQKPIKSILKQQATGSKNKSPIQKGVSWSKDMDRWHSQGSGLNLRSLVNLNQRSLKDKDTPTANHQWDINRKNNKSRSALNLSALKQEIKKHQAPCKPVRRGSWEEDSSPLSLPKYKSLGTMTSLGEKKPVGYNPFQSVVADFQNTLAGDSNQQMSSILLRSKLSLADQKADAPSKNRKDTNKGSKNNPFQSAVLDFQKKAVQEARQDFHERRQSTAMPSFCVSEEN